MSLTRDEITAGAAYTVRLDSKQLSPKRFGDAVKLVKGLNDRPETTAAYNGQTHAWTVTLPADSVGGLHDVQVLAYTYEADVERAGGSEPATAGTTRTAPRQGRQQSSAWSRAMGLHEREDGNGYTASERNGMRG